MWTDNIVWSWYETDTTVPDDKWLKISCYIMSVSKIKTCARECKNAYQHKNIYIFWNQINEIMNKSRIIDMNSNNKK